MTMRAPMLSPSDNITSATRSVRWKCEGPPNDDRAPNLCGGDHHLSSELGGRRRTRFRREKRMKHSGPAWAERSQ